jgi:hypothetical protein
MCRNCPRALDFLKPSSMDRFDEDGSGTLDANEVAKLKDEVMRRRKEIDEEMEANELEMKKAKKSGPSQYKGRYGRVRPNGFGGVSDGAEFSPLATPLLMTDVHSDPDKALLVQTSQETLAAVKELHLIALNAANTQHVLHEVQNLRQAVSELASLAASIQSTVASLAGGSANFDRTMDAAGPIFALPGQPDGANFVGQMAPPPPFDAGNSMLSPNGVPRAMSFGRMASVTRNLSNVRGASFHGASQKAQSDSPTFGDVNVRTEPTIDDIRAGTPVLANAFAGSQTEGGATLTRFGSAYGSFSRYNALNGRSG